MSNNIKKENVKYRFATPDDVSTIHDFALAAMQDTILPGFAKSIGGEMLERIELYPGNVVLAEYFQEDRTVKHDRQVVGFIEIDATRIRENAFYIRGIYVLPEYRRMGIGRDLLNIILEKKCTKNEQLRVESYSDFETKFWESLQFKKHHVSMFITKEQK